MATIINPTNHLLNMYLKNRRIAVDVKGVVFDNDMNQYILKLYFTAARDYLFWDLEAIERVRPDIIDLADLIARRTNVANTSHIGDILKFKSALVFMSRDNPTVAETLMYSPLMNNLDRIIAEEGLIMKHAFVFSSDLWPNNKEQFKSLDEICMFRNTNKLWYHKSHCWWKILLNLEMDGKVVEEESIGFHRDLQMINIEMETTISWKRSVHVQRKRVESRRIMAEIFGSDPRSFEVEKKRLDVMEKVFVDIEKAHEICYKARIQASICQTNLDEAALKSEEEKEKAIEAFVMSENNIASAELAVMQARMQVY